MPSQPGRVCPGCRRTVPAGPCPTCRRDQRRETDQARGTAAERGYGRDWQRNRAAYPREHRLCVQCRQPATVADHYPETRRSLVARGVPDPDAWHRLRPLCKTCHDRHTALTSPGGWNARLAGRQK
ncbi:HNH endonuclease [Amycolatopsis sp. TNS106]|nr:HNH endonuclease [Amycolatopsis sp. TNS106]